jgi:hypothetical protein
MGQLFHPFAARLMVDFAPVSKPTLTKRDLGVKVCATTPLRRALHLLGYSRKWPLYAEDRVKARHATEREQALGHIAFSRVPHLCAVGRRHWRLDEREDVGGTLTVLTPTPDGEFWYSVGELRLKVGDPLPEVRERVKVFLKGLPPIPRLPR